MKAARLMAFLILALLSVSWCSAGSSAAGGNPDASGSRPIGWLKWEISEDGSGNVLESGEGPVYLSDVALNERRAAFRPYLPAQSTDIRIVDKRIALGKEFDFGMAEFPTSLPEPKTGFGITATNKKTPSFSWEWFNVMDGRAIKLQEGGELLIDCKAINDAWEVVRTEFITDISLRIKRANLDSPVSSPYWRVRIFAGSYIVWPSLVDGDVAPN